MKIAHVSDPHLFDPLHARQERKKRSVDSVGQGLIQVLRRKKVVGQQPGGSSILNPMDRVRRYLQDVVYGQVGRKFHPGRLAALVSSLHSIDVDHIVITGDLTVVSAPGEYAMFRETFGPFHEEGRLTVIPGNHDTLFLRGSISFVEALGSWIPDAIFPFVRPLGERFVLIGLNSTRDRDDSEDELQFLVVNANGRIGAHQLRALAAALGWAAAEGRLPIVLVHHHILPMSLFTSRGFRDVAGEWTGLLSPLEDALSFIEVLATQELPVVVLHGHKHLSFSRPVRVPDMPNIQIMTVASALHGGRYVDVEHRRGGRVSAGYNIYEVSERGLDSVQRVVL